MLHDEDIERCLAGVSIDDPVGTRQRSAIKARLFPSHGGPVRTQIDRFVIQRELGRGGMGKVYEAYDPKLDRTVAVKLLRERLRNADDRRLMHEAQALAKLSHPNVVQIHEVGEIDGTPFIVMEQVTGSTLAEWQRPGRHWSACLDAYLQAGRGLAAAHSAGLVHRDFKPSNCIRDEYGRVRVLDFGLAQADPGRSPLTETTISTRVVVGTRGYIAPELRHGQVADHRSDQFSFCVSLYEALFGKLPFGDDDRNTPTEPPWGHPAPRWLRRALWRGLREDPAARWPSLEVLLLEIDASHRRSRRRRAALVVMLGSMATAGALFGAQGRGACPDEGALRQGVWSEETQLEVQQSLLATSRPYASETWERVESDLGQYVGAWARRYRGACEGQLAEAPVSDPTLRCLGDLRAHIAATVDLLADADDRIVDEAVTLVEGLPPLTRCENLDERSSEPPSVLATQVRHSLAVVEALQHVGRFADALERLEPLAERARASGDLELQVETWVQRGALRSDLGDFDGARGDLERAYPVALEHGYDRLAFSSAIRLAHELGFVASQHQAGITWASSAMALARRRDDVLAQAMVHQTLGTILDDNGRYREAESFHRRALTERASRLGPHHQLVGNTHHGLAATLMEQGRFEAAAGHATWALDARRDSLGPHHPAVANALFLLARIDKQKGNCVGAERLLREAEDIHGQLPSPTSPDASKVQLMLGDVLLCQSKLEDARITYGRAIEMAEGFSADPELAPERLVGRLANLEALQGRYAEAEAHTRQKLRFVERANGREHHTLAPILANLGHILMSQHKFEDAEQAYRSARRIELAHLGPNHPFVAYDDCYLGLLLIEMGRLEDAREHLQRAFDVQQWALGPEHPATARTLVGLADVAVEQRDFDRAKHHADHAAAIADAIEGHPDILASVQFVQARVMTGTASPSNEACALARRAHKAYVEYGPGASNEIADVEQWLEACDTAR
ncbi:MAG: serine/threonine-protein kinase [Myxococcota bacterium]